jgi:hypothetical protein
MLEKKGGFADRIKQERNRCYYLKFTPKDGRAAYYFLLVDPLKETAFLKALEGTEKFNLEHYGQILHSGYGEPAPELKAEMKEKYKITYDDE